MCDGQMVIPVAIVIPGRRWKFSYILGTDLLVLGKKWRRLFFKKLNGRFNIWPRFILQLVI